MASYCSFFFVALCLCESIFFFGESPYVGVSESEPQRSP